MSTPVRSNDSVCRRVLRRAKKLEFDAKDNPTVLAGPVVEVESVKAPSSADTGGISSLTGTSKGSTATATPAGMDEVRKNLNEGSLETSKEAINKEKKRRRSSKVVQEEHAVQCKKRKVKSRGMKVATRRIHDNKLLSPTNPGKKSQRQIVEEVNAAFGSNINAKTASRMVKKGLIGVSPLKKGPIGNFPKNVWSAMKSAFVTYVKLEQANSTKQSTLAQLGKRVNALVNKGGFKKNGNEVVSKLRLETADEIEVGRKNVIEQRRVQWTTYSNLNLWYDTWEETLVELGFARKKEPGDNVEGSLFFFDGQLNRIINLDETDGSLDNTAGQRGGRPPVVFYSNDINGGATQASKSTYSPTIICGSNAAGEALPPHFQLKTSAQTAEAQRISIEFIGNCKAVYGKFGFSSVRKNDCTFGMNDKAGMNSVELQKYFEKAILPLYPDIEDAPLKRVITKVDSGPGRTNLEMLAQLRLRGLYLIPGVPNTTSVTQETDQNYGPFKTGYRENLASLAQERFEQQKGLSINDVPLLVFGREKDGCVLLKSAFESSFSRESCLSAWKDCGAVPLTRAALSSPKVRHEISVLAGGTIDVDGDPQSEQLLVIESANHFACDYLTGLGFDGSQLKLKAPRRKTKQQLTAPHSKECLEAIQAAKTAGQLFHVTGGTMLSSEDMFRARALDSNKKEIEILQAKLKLDKKQTKSRVDAFHILQKKGDLNVATQNKFTLPEIKTLLQWKLGKTTGKKADLIQRYISTAAPPPRTNTFTAEDGNRLGYLLKGQVAMRDTALGAAAKQNVRAVINHLDEIGDAEKEQLLAALTKDVKKGQLKDDHRDYEDDSNTNNSNIL